MFKNEARQLVIWSTLGMALGLTLGSVIFRLLWG